VFVPVHFVVEVEFFVDVQDDVDGLGVGVYVAIDCLLF